MEDLQRSIAEQRKDFSNKDVQKHVYRFVFDFAKTGKEMTFEYARGIDSNISNLALWESLLKENQLIVKLLEYLDV